MKTFCLLAVLVLAKMLSLARFELPGSLWVLPACLWQDLLIVAVQAAIDGAGRRLRWCGWAFYVAVTAYAALNVPLARLFATPMTWPMLRATRGTIADSISHQLHWETLVPVVLVLAAGAVLPVLFERATLRPSALARTAMFLPAALLLGLGPLAESRVDLPAAHGNALFVLVTSALPRVAAQETREEWSRSPFGGGNGESLIRFRGRAAGRNLVVIHLESTGAQYLRPYGAAEDPMPHLTELARRSILFENAYATYPETIKSFFSVHCSFHPALDTQAEAYEQVASPSLAAELAWHGYRTGLFHSGRFMYLGMDSVVNNRGFETLEDAGDIGGNRRSSFGIDEAATVKRMLGWLDALPKDQPFLLTYLPIAGHHPYETPAGGPFPESREIDRYRNALHDADAALGELLAGLEARGRLQNTLLVIFGDHGEAFDQHPGNFGHTMFVYEENVRIPYLIAAPGLIEEPLRIARIASQVDTAPTVMDLLGFDRPSEWQGRSLLDPRAGMALFCTDYAEGFLGLRDGRWKFIHELDSRRSKLFDVEDDPGEQRDLSERFPEQVRAYREHLLRWSAAQKFLVERASKSP